MARLSEIVITQDEAANIADCLRSLAFCDELIVVDSGSEDDTVAQARAAGARVSVHAFAGFGAQKSHALSLATGDWVLSIDADERVTPDLAAEIGAAVVSDSADGYLIPRLSTFCGRPMRHSGWYPDRVLRLFRRASGRFSDNLVHERVICDGKIARLTQPIVHHPITKLDDALLRVQRYATAGAAEIVASGRRVSFASGVLHGAWAFVRTYFLRAGFLDGPHGFLVAVYNAECTYYRYMKAWLAQRPRRSRSP